jgi:hypothetical protein
MRVIQCGNGARLALERKGRALEQDEQIRLFNVAQSKPKYRCVYVLLILCHYCGMPPCESFGLKRRNSPIESFV